MIRNIIFDLGGVILGIDYKKTVSAFQTLGAPNFDRIYSQFTQTRVFDQFETGKISASQFRQALREELLIQSVSDIDFDRAWNAMLLSIPTERFDLLERLRPQFRTYLFSNINEIHHKKLAEILIQIGQGMGFEPYFDKVYYSHLVGFKKPHSSSFKKILLENDLMAEETLFIDDSIQHVLGSQKAGLKAVCQKKGADLKDILKREGIKIK